jgi:hypothetical protein
MRAFQCQHSDLLLPGDWVKEWGRKYGHGLGPVPVSPCLDSQYHCTMGEAHEPNSGVMMHPVGYTYAGIQEVDVTKEEFAKRAMILHEDDRQMTKRVKVILEKQKARKQEIAKAAYRAAGGT